VRTTPPITAVLLVLLALLVLAAGCTTAPGAGPSPTAPETGAATAGSDDARTTGEGTTGDGAADADGGTAEGRTATVARVIDGDTVAVAFADGERETVRLLGVDTPEIRGAIDPTEFEGVPDTEAGREWLDEWGRRASAFAREELEGRQVTVAVDEAADRRDRYGRLLAYLTVEGESDSFNRQLLDEGYARLYESRFARRGAFARSEARARAEGAGLWGYTVGQKSVETRRQRIGG
jgi:micrococcal nuclease